MFERVFSAAFCLLAFLLSACTPSAPRSLHVAPGTARSTVDCSPLPLAERLSGYELAVKAWSESGLTLNHAQRALGRENCHASARRFSGCLRTFQLHLGKEFAKTSEGSIEPPWDAWYADIKSGRAPEVAFEGAFERAVALLRTKNPMRDGEAQNAVAAGVLIRTYLRETLDAHTSLGPSEAFDRQIQESDPVKVGGIGVQFASSDTGAEILWIQPGSPVLPKLQRGDRIVSIEGQSVQDLPAAEIQAKLIGREGCPVRLSIIRFNSETRIESRFELTVPRVASELSPVTGYLLREGRLRIGYLKVNSFMGERVADDAIAELQKLRNQSPDGLILDLRGNTGGLTQQALKLAEAFLPPDLPLITQSRIPWGPEEQAILDAALPGEPAVDAKKLGNRARSVTQRTPTYSRMDGWVSVPMVVVVDRTTGSASEIVTGILQDYERAWVVGERTFGKGSAQLVLPLVHYKGLTLRLTQLLYAISDERFVQRAGIPEDFHATPPTPPLRALKREDGLSNSLPSPPSRKFEPRSERIHLIEKCIARMNEASKAQNRFDRERSEGKTSDYARMMAEDVLACHLETEAI